MGERHLKLLDSRIELINFFVDKRGLNHKFFEGATGHLAIIIQSEGFFEATTIFPPEKFVALVKDLRRLIDEDKFDEIFSL